MTNGDHDTLPFGLYELVESKATPTEMFPRGAHVEKEMVEDAERARVLSVYVAKRLEQRLLTSKREEHVDIINSVLAGLDPSDGILWSDKANFRQVTALSPVGAEPVIRPRLPLSEAALLTNARQQPRLEKEIARELASADRVDLLCSFLKLSGISLIRPALEELQQRGVRVRIIATTYMGATDAKAVDTLHRLGAEVKISYQNSTTRLHAKAWLFDRDSGFSTAYVGSSNLSAAAMTDGLEWNVRLSSVLTPGVLQQFRSAFDGYWNDPEFVTYHPEQYDELDRALQRAGTSGGDKRSLAALDTSFLDVDPRHHQSIMLDHLAAERSHGHHRNLVVAATGTGKTILSALDFRSLTEQMDDPSLLFVAHRNRILSQARAAFAATMRSSRFGEFLADGETPQRWKHVFASIQTLSRSWIDRIDPAHFDVVIIDEFHHASARTYRQVLEALKPKELIGLTATPERSDGTNVAHMFFDGRVATELRLWDALDADLLVPFHYFGISDGTDLSGLEVKQGDYAASDLDRLYVESAQSEARLRIIFEELEEKIADPRRMRALGFCASKKHARFMADAFNRANIAAVVLVGEDDEQTRNTAVEQLLDKDHPLAIIFTVDIFNEGVDIPEVDTILMLRPTQSPTLFQQQLGRGLRRAPGKALLTVLDFVGNQSRLYRFDRKYSVFARSGRLKQVELEQEFPDLPPGCTIELDEFTQSQITSMLKQTLQLPTSRLKEEVTAYFSQVPSRMTSEPALQLGPFLADTGRGIENIYGIGTSEMINGRKKTIKCTWTYLTVFSGVENGLTHLFADDMFVDIQNRIQALCHVNDAFRREGYLELLFGRDHERDLSAVERRLAWMLVFTVWNRGKFSGCDWKFTLDEALDALRQYPQIGIELEQIWDIVADSDRHITVPVPGMEGSCALLTHGLYSREELFAGLALHETEKKATPGSAVEGVLESAALDAVALLVTLEKTERHYSPQTMYKDYAVTQAEFAWDSQNATTPDSRRGRMYQGLGDDRKTPLLFVRRTKNAGLIPNATEPYIFLGPLSYVRHEGSEPMHITWELERPMPAEVFSVARAVA